MRFKQEANVCLAKKLPVVIGTQWTDEVAGTKIIFDGVHNGSRKKLKGYGLRIWTKYLRTRNEI